MRRLLILVLVPLAVIACGDDPGPATTTAASVPDRFDSARAWRTLEHQVEMGPRPAGSRTSRKLAKMLRNAIPKGRYQSVPDGLRNVIGRVPGKDPKRLVVVGAHYDTKDIPNFVGAVDGASGTAVVTQLARTIKPRTARSNLVFIFFDGEETPRGTPDRQFKAKGLRGSKVAARRYASQVDAMVLLDFVGDRDLSIPREQYSDDTLWLNLRAAAERAGAEAAFPNEVSGGILDDHIPFIERGVPAIDLIDFDFPCWHRRCDDLSAVSERSLDVTGEAVYRFVASL